MSFHLLASHTTPGFIRNIKADTFFPTRLRAEYSPGKDVNMHQCGHKMMISFP